MKAVIVEIHNNTAVILSDEGCVVRVKNNNYQIGQEVEINMKKVLRPKRTFAFASAACLLFFFSIGANAYYTPYTYVSLDVNPSIEYSVNKFGKVLSVSGVNDDGTEIIHEISLDNLKYKSITDAISLTVDAISEAGYLNADTGGIIITTSSENEEEADDLAQNLEASAIEACEDNDRDATVTVEAVGAKRVTEARELGVTPGKLNLVEKLIESSGNEKSINREEWLNKSVKDIMTQTKAYKKQNKAHEQTAVEYTQNEEQTQSEESDDNLDQTESLSENSVNKKSSATKKQSASSSKGNSDTIKESSAKSDAHTKKESSISSNNGNSDTAIEQPVDSNSNSVIEQSVDSGNGNSDTTKNRNENSNNSDSSTTKEKEKDSGNSSTGNSSGSNSSSGKNRK